MAHGSDPLTDSVPGHAPADLENTLALLARAGGGDRDAANEIFVRYEERIRRIVRVRLGANLRRWTESGDLIQETCRAAFEGLGKLELTSEFDFLDWLGRVATNRIRDYVDHLRAGKRDVARAVPMDIDPDAHSASDDSPADLRTGPSGEAFRAEVRELLDQVVAGLPENYREVVLLRDYQGAEWPDVARSLAVPGVHAAQQLHQRAWIRVRSEAAPRLAGLRND